MGNKEILNNAEMYGHALVELISADVITQPEARQLLGFDVADNE